MSAIDEEKIKNRLDEILNDIQSEADPNLLNQYRSLIRQKVSFFRRSYLAAYLLMLQDQGAGRSRDSQRRKAGNEAQRGDSQRGARKPNAGQGEGAGQNRPSQRQEQRPDQPAPKAAPVALPEDEAVRLFISVGRNRRVFPREILALIGTKTGVSREDIGTINILNNYSFVQVRSTVAEDLIEALNGVTFRGRTIAVNYARARKEEGEDDEALPEARIPRGIPSDNDAADTNDDTSDSIFAMDDAGETSEADHGDDENFGLNDSYGNDAEIGADDTGTDDGDDSGTDDDPVSDAGETEAE